jgi:hypothetical protein
VERSTRESGNVNVRHKPAAAKRKLGPFQMHPRASSPAGDHPAATVPWPDQALKNCANSLYICGVQAVFYTNKINNLAANKTGCNPAAQPLSWGRNTYPDG